MASFGKTLATCVLWLGAAAAPALAGSMASSSVSDSVSTSVGSVSDSIQGSSAASSKSSERKEVAAGDYRVLDIAAVAERPGMVRVTLQAVANPAPDYRFELHLPRLAAERGQLAPGAIVTARQRDYGLEFAAGQARQAFFLVLNDERYRELPSKPVTL